MESLLGYVATFVISFISETGYAGIVVLMALESANIPIPSEIIMPFSGYLVSAGTFEFFWVVFWGAVGNLAGSLVSYAVGFWGGRAFLVRYGKFFFVSLHEIEKADQWFKRYGAATAFFSRLLPIVRTFVSFPAGIAKMNVWKFSAYTFAGSFVWSLLLTYLGVLAGENWKHLETYFQKFDWLILLMLVAAGAGWVVHKVKRNTNQKTL